MEQQFPGGSAQLPPSAPAMASTRPSSTHPIEMVPASEGAAVRSTTAPSAAVLSEHLKPVPARGVVEVAHVATQSAEPARSAVVAAADEASEVIPVPNAVLVPALDGCRTASPVAATAEPASAATAGTSGESTTMNFAWKWTTNSEAPSAYNGLEFARVEKDFHDRPSSASLSARMTNVPRGTYHADAYPCEACGYHFDVRMDRRQAFLDWFRDGQNLGHHVLFGMSLLLATSLTLALTLSWLEASRRVASLSLLLSVPLGLFLLVHSFVWASVACYGLWQYPRAYWRWKGETLPVVGRHLVHLAQTGGATAFAQTP